MLLMEALLAEEGSPGGLGGEAGVPGDYGANLISFMDADQGVATGPTNDYGVETTDWTDQASGKTFSLPSSGDGGSREPIFESNSQNGLPGINFQQPLDSLLLDRKLSDDQNTMDNFFSGQGNKSLAFACRKNRATDTKFNTSSTIMSKGYVDSGGWDLGVKSDGTMIFRHRRSDGTTWQVTASGFFGVGDPILGYLVYSGGNSTGSGFFRLYDGNEFVTVGSVSTGGSSNIGYENTKLMVLGNIINTNNLDANSPFQGPIFATWATKPALNTFDESYLLQWA